MLQVVESIVNVSTHPKKTVAAQLARGIEKKNEPCRLRFLPTTVHRALPRYVSQSKGPARCRPPRASALRPRGRSARRYAPGGRCRCRCQKGSSPLRAIRRPRSLECGRPVACTGLRCRASFAAVAQEAGIAEHRRKSRRDFDFERDLSAAGFHQRGFPAAFNEFENATGENSSSSFPASIRASFERSSVSRARRLRVVHDFEKAPVVFWIFERAAQKRFREALYRGKRRLEFMRDVGDEVLARSLEPQSARRVAPELLPTVFQRVTLQKLVPKPRAPGP